MSTLRQAAQQALEALEIGHDSAKAEADQFHSAMAGYKPQRHAQMDADVQTIAKAITALRAALAEPEGKATPITSAEMSAWVKDTWEKCQAEAWQEPVAVGMEWSACTKLPVTVHVRAQRPGETHVSTREGITPVKSNDLIMRGVSGEEYPIGREIFEQTYRMGEAAPTPRSGINAELVEALRRIESVNAMDYEYRAWAREALAKVGEQT